MTLGRYPLIPLKEARITASEALQAVEEGRDPAAEREASKAEVGATVDRNAFSKLLEQFDRRHLSKLKSGYQNKAALDAYALPAWKDRDVRTITRRDVIELLDSIVDEGKATTANRLRAYLSKFFGWLVERDVIEVSPVVGVKPPTKENMRDRVLSDDEIRWFWKACELAGAPWDSFGKLLLLTGQRRREVSDMTESEIHEGIWSLSANRTKNGRAHDVPLSSAARIVLRSNETVSSPSGYTHTTNGLTPISGFNNARNNIAKHMEAIAAKERGEVVEIPRWTWHDLRRTTATGMARLGIPVRVTEAVLNHVSGTGGGIVAVYQRHDYAGEKRDALETWGNFVQSMVEDGKE